MRSNSKWIRCIAIAVVVCLSALWIDGCGTHDVHNTTIQGTISELRANAKSWEADNSDEARSYLAPAFLSAIPRLEKDGASVLPIMLAATFRQGYYDVNAKITGLFYTFTWLALDDEVKGFYLRREGKPDLEVYPAFSKEPQVPGTAWMVTSGPVVTSEKERAKVVYKEMAIIVDAEILARKKVLVGLVLANGQKTSAVPAYFRPGPPG